MSARERLQNMRDIANSVTFDSLEIVDGPPKDEEIIYNGFPIDVIQRMDVPEQDKVNLLNMRVQRIVMGFLNDFSRLGKSFDELEVKAWKQVDDHTGREIFVLFVTK